MMLRQHSGHVPGYVRRWRKADIGCGVTSGGVVPAREGLRRAAAQSRSAAELRRRAAGTPRDWRAFLTRRSGRRFRRHRSAPSAPKVAQTASQVLRKQVEMMSRGQHRTRRARQLLRARHLRRNAPPAICLCRLAQAVLEQKGKKASVRYGPQRQSASPWVEQR